MSGVKIIFIVIYSICIGVNIARILLSNEDSIKRLSFLALILVTVGLFGQIISLRWDE